MARIANRSTTSGISLYTMLAAVVVLGVLGSVTITQYDGAGSRATAATALVIDTAQAAQRFHLDTGCYATNVTALMSREAASTNNTCEHPIATSRWHGPYIAPSRTVPRSQGDPDAGAYDYPTLPVKSLGPTAKLAVYNYHDKQPAVWIGNLPAKTFKSLETKFPRPSYASRGDRAYQYYYNPSATK